MKIISLEEFRDRKKVVNIKDVKIKSALKDFRSKLYHQNQQINKIDKLIKELNDVLKSLK